MPEDWEGSPGSQGLPRADPQGRGRRPVAAGDRRGVRAQHRAAEARRRRQRRIRGAVTDAVAARCREVFERDGAGASRSGAASSRVPSSDAVDVMCGALRAGRKILVCGNGGSAAESQHFAAELTGRFRRERGALAALALSVDTSALTAIGNDYGFERVFCAAGRGAGPGRATCCWRISTSGRSPNVVQAAQVARARQMTVVALTGRVGGCARGTGARDAGRAGCRHGARAGSAPDGAACVV